MWTACLPQVGIIEVPEDGSVWMGMYDFEYDFLFLTIQVNRSLD
jgi:hypothetical protein